MATFNMWLDLLRPLGEWLQAAPELTGINIFHDYSDTKVVQRSAIPAINYFWIPPTEDVARGSGSTSLQVRRKRVTVGFGVWAASTDPSVLQEALWEMVGVLEDLLRSKTNFDPRKGISLQDAISNDWHSEESEGTLIGAILVSAHYELFAGPFAGGVSM